MQGISQWKNCIPYSSNIYSCLIMPTVFDVLREAEKAKPQRARPFSCFLSGSRHWRNLDLRSRREGSISVLFSDSIRPWWVLDNSASDVEKKRVKCACALVASVLPWWCFMHGA